MRLIVLIGSVGAGVETFDRTPTWLLGLGMEGKLMGVLAGAIGEFDLGLGLVSELLIPSQ